MRRSLSFSIVFCLMIVCFLQSTFAFEKKQEKAKDPFGKSVIVERHKLTNVASRIWYSNPNFGAFLHSLPKPLKKIRGYEIDIEMIERHAPKILKKYKTLLGIDPKEFTLERADWDGEYWYVSFDQFYKGVPVYTGKFGFTVNNEGNIISIGSDGYPGLNLSVTPQRSTAELVEIVKSRFVAENKDSLALLTQPKLLIYPERLEEEIKYFLAYKIELHDKLGGDERRYFIDANTAMVLSDESMWLGFGNWTVSGNVKGKYWPKTSSGSQEEATARQSTLVRVINNVGLPIATGVTDANGNYSFSGNDAYQTFYVEVELKGSWSKIKNSGNQVDASQSFVTSGNSTRNFNFTDTNDGFHVYHHMNVIHDFIKGSPFNYNGMNWQMLAKINDNSANGGAGSDGVKLIFGNQGANWWEAAHIVYHEYTHNIVRSIYGHTIGSTGGEMGSAMSEGIADYFSATIRGTSVLHWTVPSRTVSNNFTMDDYDGFGSFHDKGQILSGAMWDLESTISKNTARKLNFKAMQITPRPDTFVEFVNNVILADDNNGKLCDATPNYSAILQAFQTNHGIVPTLNVGTTVSVTIDGPDDIEPNESNTWTADVCGGSGSISYQWSVKYEGGSTWNSLGTSQSQSHTFFNNNTYNEIKVEVTRGTENTEDTRVVFVNNGGGFKRADHEIAGMPEEFELQQNHPNPFNPETEIRYTLPEAGFVKLVITDALGRRVRTLVDQNQSRGWRRVVWDGRDASGEQVASGVYFYRITVRGSGKAPVFSKIKKMSLVR